MQNTKLMPVFGLILIKFIHRLISITFFQVLIKYNSASLININKVNIQATTQVNIKATMQIYIQAAIQVDI